MDDLAIARALHVLTVIHWMGGVAFVTAVVLPAIAGIGDPWKRIELFQAIEGRFSTQVRLSVPLAGASGIYMVDRLDLWGRFLQPESWFLAAMGFVWLLFMVILFVLEPLVLHEWFHRRAIAEPERMFRLIQRAHWGLLAAGAATAGAGVLGAHGLLG